MNAVAKYAPYVEWDVRNWSAAPEFWERETKLRLGRCTALEVGSRHGGLSLWLARHGAKVICSDLDGPTALARTSHRAAGVADRVEYAALDVTDLPYRDHFDIALFKSVLGTLGGDDVGDGARAAQAQAITQLHRALRPGGELFFAENLSASPAHRFLRRRFVGWGRRWRYVTVDEMLRNLSPFREVVYCTVGFFGAFGRSQRQRRILGSVDRVFVNHFIPESWRYIMIGLARK